MVERTKRFVYGSFYWPNRSKFEPPPRKAPIVFLPGSAKPTAWDQLALEIMREYSPTELIGKIHYKGPINMWIPMDPSTAEELDWYKWFTKLARPARASAKMYYFNMEGSGRWIVLNFRKESDEAGPYMAVALRYAE